MNITASLRRLASLALLGCAFLLAVPQVSYASSSEPTPSQSSTRVVEVDGQSDVEFFAAEAPATEVVGADSLPAWRWGSVTLDADTSGFFSGVTKSLPVMIATLTLGAAQLIWTLLLGLGRLGLDSTSILSVAAPAVNNGAAAIGSRLYFFVPLFLAVALWRVVKLMMRGAISQAFRVGLTFAVLFSLMTVVTSTSVTASKLPADQQISYKGSLPWFANEVASVSAKLTGQIVSATSLLPTTTGGKVQNPQGVTPTCDQYILALHNRYLDGSEGAATLSALSKLWEQTQYKAWQAAQFGTEKNGIDIPGRVMCHWAEAVNEVSPTAQQDFSSTYAYPGMVKNSSSGRVLAFGPYSDDDRRRAMTAWAVCQYDGKAWSTRPEWIGVWGKSATDDQFGKDRCGDVFATDGSLGDKGNGIGLWGFDVARVGDDDKFNLFGASLSEAFENENQGPELRDKLVSAKAFANAFNGNNSSDRLLQGFLAVIVALLFFWAIGFMAVGLLLAQFMLVVLLLMAPLTLVLYAFGSNRGVAVLKLTGTTMVSQAFFSLLLTTLIAIADVFQRLALTIPAGGIIRTVLTGLSPVAAFWCVRKLMRSVGMADIMKPSGAASFVASAALVATGDKSFAAAGKVGADGRNSIQRAGSQTAAKGIGAGLAAGGALARGGAMLRNQSRMTPEQRKAARIGRKNDKKAAQASELVARREGLAKAMSGRLDANQTDRLNRLSNWMDKRALQPKVDENGNPVYTPFQNALLRASELRDASIAGLTPEVSGALGVGKSAKRTPIGSTWQDQRINEGADVPLMTIGESEPVGEETAKLLNRFDRMDLDRSKSTARSAAEIEQLHENYVSEAIHGAAAATFGEDFGGFTSELEVAGAKTAAARQFGGSPEDWVVASNGIIMPNVAGMSRSDIQKSRLPAEVMNHPVMWLAEDVRALRPSETADQWSARMVVTMRELDLADSQGRTVRMLDKMELTVDDVSDWKEGAKNTLLDSRKLRVHNTTQMARLEQATRAHLQNHYESMSEARSGAKQQFIVEIDELRAALPVGAASVSTHWSTVETKAARLDELAVTMESRRATGADVADLEAERRKARKDYDSTFTTWRSAVLEQASARIAAKYIDSSLNGQTLDATKLTEQMIGDMEGVRDYIDELEQLSERAYAGQRDAIADVRTYGAILTAQAESEAEQLTTKITDTLSTMNRTGEQSQATARRNRVTNMPTSRDIVNSVTNAFPDDWESRKGTN